MWDTFYARLKACDNGSMVVPSFSLDPVIVVVVISQSKSGVEGARVRFADVKCYTGYYRHKNFCYFMIDIEKEYKNVKNSNLSSTYHYLPYLSNTLLST